MRSNWGKSLAFVLQDEGGNDDDPNDSGGRTSRGITAREYAAWCQLMNKPGGDVWQASQNDIDAIYQQQYWLPECDYLPVPIDYLFFDFKVNAGPHQATILLQRAVKVADDGHFGVVTMAAVQKADPKDFIETFSAEKIAFYKEVEREHPQDVTFDKGWMNRVANVKARAWGMIS